MPSLAESGATAKSPFGAAAQLGVETISVWQDVTFNLYNRVVLSADGQVFWVKQTPTVAATTQLTVLGSLHYATINTQEEAASISQNRVVFTAQAPVNELNVASPTTLWIAVLDNGVRYAFSQRGSWYEQADLWHYIGTALYADMQTQIIDNPADVPDVLIVSNSLPLWLTLNGFTPPNPGLGFACPVTLFPAFLVPENLDPTTTPYGAVDILPEATEGLASSPTLDSTSSHYQLVKDTVRITLYGCTNAQALTFIDCVNAYSLNYGLFGVMNIPVIRDEQRTQAEFGILAMKKTVTFEVNYYEQTTRAVARQLILHATPTFYPQPL